jgi:hypothetical protein
MQDFCRLSTTEKAIVLAMVARLGIKILKDLTVLQSQETHIWDQRSLRIRGTLQAHMDLNLDFIDQLAASEIIPEGHKCDSAGAWSWKEYSNLRDNIENAQAYNYLMTHGLNIQRWNET